MPDPDISAPHEVLVSAVRLDVLDGLEGAFDRGELEESFHVLEELTPEGGWVNEEGMGVVSWECTATNNGPWSGLLPTCLRIEIIGCTHVLGFVPDAGASQRSDDFDTDLGLQQEDGITSFTRFVDWANVLAQMGVTFNSRQPIVPGEDQAAS